MPYGEVLPYLIKRGLIVPKEMNPVIPPYPPGFDTNARCDFHDGAYEHSTKDCKVLKSKPYCSRSICEMVCDSDVVCIICSAGLLQLFHLGTECRLMNVDGCYVLLCCKCTFIGMVVLVMQHVGCLGVFHAIPAGFAISAVLIRLLRIADRHQHTTSGQCCSAACWLPE
ncbi:hypothetical protein KIW84_025211 [Lathyrus oleraceus]|uniref:Uncharacterized protein n=1 Tax=Pisum sativum TaxID=3888 RepID=A0A9D5BDF1_PEA|nr:hypothetical protein KIW84_025211 [Pisum sativum]